MLFIFLNTQNVKAQYPERWEHLGPVTFTSIVAQSPSVLVMTTADGWLYVSSDFVHTWKHRYIDDTLDLIDAKFVDSLDGILAASDGTVLFTSDGGATWDRSHIPGGALGHLAYPSHDSAYICSHDAVWQTTDRGQSWKLQMVYSSNMINAIYFFGDDTGFAVGDAGLFARTTDAGAHWSTQDIGAGDTLDLTCMDFYGRDTGVVVGAGHAFITTDGGVSWRITGVLPTFYNKPTIVKLTSDHAFFGFIEGIDEFSSTDLGASFRPLQQIFGSGESAVNGACSVADNRIVIAGGDGEVEQTLNAGASWQPLNLCISGYNLIHTGDSTLCGVGGYTGRAFYRSTDGGDSWVSYDMYRPDIYNQTWPGLWFTSPLEGIAVNSDASLSQSTTDGGLTWATTGVNGLFGGIGSFYTRDKAAMFFSDDSICITRDRGKTWLKSQPVVDTSSPYPQFPASKSHPPILMGGSILDSVHAYLIYEIIDTIIGLTIHSHYRYYQTMDAGQNWREIKSAPYDEGGNIYFQKPSLGFICGWHGQLYRSSDDGSTWQSQTLTGDHGISAVKFLNDTLGFCVANDASHREGLVFMTTNGGLTWHDDSLRYSVAGLSGIIFPDSNTVLLLSKYGFYRRHLPSSTQESVSTDPSAPVPEISVYPNPAVDWLSVSGLGGTANVIDALGRSYSCPWQNGRLNVSSLPPGIYFVGDGTVRAKFVKE